MSLKIRVKEVATEFKSFDELKRGDLFRKCYDRRTIVYLKINTLEYFVICGDSGIGHCFEYNQAERHMNNCVPINGTLEIES